jgi:hypothetical protein
VTEGYAQVDGKKGRRGIPTRYRHRVTIARRRRFPVK